MARAIQVAQENQRAHVYLSVGTFEGDGLALFAGLTIEGGWSDIGGVWTPLCGVEAAEKTIIKAASNNVTLRADDLDGSAEVRFLTLQSHDLQAAPGESFYGLFATGQSTRVKLDQVRILVRAGEPGPAGLAGADEVLTAEDCRAATGSAGSPGAPASEAAPAAFDASGFVSVSGLPGGKGGTGENGTAGGEGPCRANCATQCIRTPSMNCLTAAVTTMCGAPGVSGCGGQGGDGGGGGGGGSSVALFASDATIDVRGGKLEAGAGGTGGAGGAGGLGAAGTPGRVGAENGSCQVCGGSAACNIPTPVPGGSQGGDGGNGGPGARGGGGAGGHSHAAYHRGAGHLDLDGTELVVGAAGAGGGGSPEGRNGIASPTLLE